MKKYIKYVKRTGKQKPVFSMYHGNDFHCMRVLCPKCESPVDSNFCKYCGTEIDWSEE